MNKNSNTLFGSKQNNTVVKNIVEAEPMMFGVPTESNKVGVKFAVHSGDSIAKGRTDGELVFNAIGNTGAIYLGDTLVSSKILDVTYAQKTDASAGINEIVIKYLDASGVINTTDALEVVDDARVAALIADFKKDVFDPYKDATNASIGRIDTSVNNLETWAKTAGNLTEAGNGAITVTPTAGENGFQTWTVGTNVDGKTIVINGEDKLATDVKIKYVAAKAAEGEGAAVPAHIALVDNAGKELSTIAVSDLVGNGQLKSTEYHKETGILDMVFAQADGTNKKIEVNLGDLLDVNDILVSDGSKKYVGIDLTGAENSQFVLSTKMQAVKTATADTTGLVDAYDVKSTLDASFGALKEDLDASTNYISVGIEQENGRIQNLTINSSISDVTASAGTRGTWNVTDEGGATLSGETAPSISGIANSLVDGAQAVGAIKTYVDAKVSAEAAERDAKISAAVKALDVAETEVIADNHLTIKFEEIDGKVSINASTADIASSALLGTKGDASTAETAFGYIAKEAALRTQAIEALDVPSNTVDGTNTHVTYKEENGIVTIQSISEDYATITRTAHADKTESAEMVAAAFEVTDGGKLVKGSDLADLKAYTDDKIGEAVANQAAILEGLDNTVKDEDDDFIKISIVQENGLLKSTDLQIKYGTFAELGSTVTADGLAKVSTVQNFVNNALTWQVIA